MKENSLYIEHTGKVIKKNDKFSHVMAITLNPGSDYKEGLVRCITSRSGDLSFQGNIDRSELHLIKGDSLESFEIHERVKMKNEENIIQLIRGIDGDFIGLEDPDIWIDKGKDILHVYFTIPIIHTDKNQKKVGKSKVHLGHAEGKNLSSLVMTAPVLLGNDKNTAKEVSIAPLNSKGFRYNLIESKDRKKSTHYSVVKVAIAYDMSGPWEYGDTVFHPHEHKLSWIAGHASPGPLFSKNFIDLGDNKLVGIMNGCEANSVEGEKVRAGDFSIGLFIYDYELGKIDWVSPEPLIQDSEAGKGGGRAITFASQFIETKRGEGILYAHVDDSFVRAYTLEAEKIRDLLPLK